MGYEFTKQDLAELKTLAIDAKDYYYNKNRFLKIRSADVSEAVADALVNSELVRGKARLKYGDDIPRTIEINDAVYDCLESILNQHGVTLGVRAPAVGKVDADLPYPMPSLEKARMDTGQLQKFTAKNKGPYVASMKMDGISLEIVYAPGKPVKVYTGTEVHRGKDVSFLAPSMNIPKSLKTALAIRAEGIISRSNFENHWSEKYKNARNLASGIMNKKGVHEAMKHLDVVCYEVLSPRGVPSEQLAMLKKLGFHVVPHVKLKAVTDESLTRILRKWKAESEHDIDGVVVCADYKTPVQSSDYSKVAIAFKEEDESNQAESKVVKVIWQVSKYGYLKPVLNIEPVKLAGVTVTRVTAHNAKTVQEEGIGVGATISLTRSGEVIPFVTGVPKPVKPAMPSKSEFGPYHWSKNKVDLILDDAAGHDTAATKMLSDFLTKGLGIEFVGTGIVAKLIDAGLSSPRRLLSARRQAFYEVEGFKDTMVDKLYSQLQEKKKHANIVKVAAASGVFGRSFGNTRMQAIEDHLGILKCMKMPERSVVSKVSALSGFSEATAEVFAEALPKFEKFLAPLNLEFEAPKKVKATGQKLEGQAVGFTGFRDTALEEYIKSQGGEVTNGVTAKTTILLAKDASSGSSKLQKAIDKGIAVMTPDQFKRKY